MTRALHWIVTTLKDSGFGSGAGALTLGEYLVPQELSPIVCVVLSLGDGLGGVAAVRRRKTLGGAALVPQEGDSPSPLL